LWPVTAVRGASIVASFGSFDFPVRFLRQFLLPRAVTTANPFFRFPADAPLS
jgi:hypothetical protein